mgnify:CR=1 FL=1
MNYYIYGLIISVVYNTLTIALKHIYNEMATGQFDKKGSHKIIRNYPIPLNFDGIVC